MHSQAARVKRVKKQFGAAAYAVAFVIFLNSGGNLTMAAEPDGLAWPLATQTDSFKCYEVEDSTKIRIGSVGLEDEFGEKSFNGVRVGKAKIYCSGAVKNQQGDPISPNVHLICYKIRSGEPKRTLAIENEFGAQRLVIDDARHLCVPGVTREVQRGDRLENRPRRWRKPR